MKVASIVILVLAVLIAVVPQYTDCESHGRMLTLDNGKQVSMKCHWTARAELGLGLPLAGVGLMMFGSRRKESRRILGIAGIALGAVTIMLPANLIGVCMNPDMPCLAIMKPSLLLMGTLVIGISLAVVIRSWGREDEVA